MIKVTLLYVFLLVVVVAIAISLIRASRSALSQIKLEDLLIGADGKLSKAAVVMLGAFGITSWLMVYLATTGHMTEGYLAIYVAAWIAPTVTVLIKGGPPLPNVQTTTLVQRETTIAAPAAPAPGIVQP